MTHGRKGLLREQRRQSSNAMNEADGPEYRPETRRVDDGEDKLQVPLGESRRERSEAASFSTHGQSLDSDEFKVGSTEVAAECSRPKDDVSADEKQQLKKNKDKKRKNPPPESSEATTSTTTDPQAVVTTVTTTTNATSTSGTVSGTFTVQPNDNDVLLGRGRPFQSHPGNLRLHRIVNLHKDQYQQSRRYDKLAIAERVVHEIKNGGDGLQPGRFLRRKEGEEPSWEEVPDEVAREKVSHALRGKVRRPSLEEPYGGGPQATGGSLMGIRPYGLNDATSATMGCVSFNPLGVGGGGGGFGSIPRDFQRMRAMNNAFPNLHSLQQQTLSGTTDTPSGPFMPSSPAGGPAQASGSGSGSGTASLANILQEQQLHQLLHAQERSLTERVIQLRQLRSSLGAIEETKVQSNQQQQQQQQQQPPLLHQQLLERQLLHQRQQELLANRPSLGSLLSSGQLGQSRERGTTAEGGTTGLSAPAMWQAFMLQQQQQQAALMLPWNRSDLARALSLQETGSSSVADGAPDNTNIGIAMVAGSTALTSSPPPPHATTPSMASSYLQSVRGGIATEEAGMVAQTQQTELQMLLRNHAGGQSCPYTINRTSSKGNTAEAKSDNLEEDLRRRFRYNNWR